MARMLIIFGTTDGHTAKIATFMGGALRGTGASVTVVQPTGTAPSPAELRRGHRGGLCARR